MLILGRTLPTWVSRPELFHLYHRLSSHIIVSCQSQIARADRRSFESHLHSADIDPERRAGKWTGSRAASCSRTLWQDTQLLIDVLSVAGIKSVTFLLLACVCINTRSLWYLTGCLECHAGQWWLLLHHLCENDLQLLRFWRVGLTAGKKQASFIHNYTPRNFN